MKRGSGAVLLFTLISPTLTQAQERVQIGPGDRVRVRSAECFQEAKTLQFASLAGDTLWVMAGGQELGCPTSKIIRLEVLRPTSIWKPSAIGLLVGVAAGALFLETMVDCSLFDCDFPKAPYLVGGIAGGVVGLGIGVLIGIWTPDDWEEVPLPPGQPFVQVSAGSHLGFGFSIRLRR
jgi:hypothetical protein